MAARPRAAADLARQMARWRSVLAAEPANRVALLRLARLLAAARDGAGLLALADDVGGRSPRQAGLVLDLATEAMPDDAALALAACQHADRHTAPATRNLRWLLARQRFPDDAAIAAGYAAMRREQAGGAPTGENAIDPLVAEAALKARVERAPDDAASWLDYCRVGADRLGLAHQMRRWRQARAHLPESRAILFGLVDCLTCHHRFGQAAAELEQALVGQPDDVSVLEKLAATAEAGWDWPAARHWLSRLARLCPETAALTERLGHAEAEATMARGRALPTGPMLAPPSPLPCQPRLSDQAMHELLLGFENLGANCEFGLLQRSYGAEPLGLLRFAATSPRTLLILLRTRFAGLGEAGQMRLVAGPRDYLVRHEPSRWAMHTRIRPGPDAHPQALLAQQCRHVDFLRRKLMRDLARGEKIFVYQRQTLSDTEINDIYDALQAYGPNRLLCVRVADAQNMAGSVEWRAERLMIGTIDRVGRGRDATEWDISAGYWAYFCGLARGGKDKVLAAL